jgi:sterol desaturase/sphingolipid hydroxylase (fatty acid hydroxylase superfamily)
MNILAAKDQCQPSPFPQITHSGAPNDVGADSSAISASASRIRYIVAGGLVALVVACLGIRLLHPFAFVSADAPRWLVHGLWPLLRKLIAGRSRLSMTVYPCAVLVILMLERWFPAVPTQKTLSTGLIHDVLWVLIETAVGVVLVAYGMALSRFYARHLSFLTLPVPQSLPLLARLAIGALVLDLARWFQHWLHHRLIFLWPFHAVHHSQREINLFSNYRIHFVELFASSALAALPMLMLKVETPMVVWWLLLMTWYARLYHANIKSNFGPLRYIFVTPQSHRVHHSRHSEHFDQNYGAILSVWDHLFGTQHRRYDVYPETGIDDEEFPVDKGQSVFGVLAAPVRQTLYPFRQLWMKRKPAAAATPHAGLPPARSPENSTFQRSA